VDKQQYFALAGVAIGNAVAVQLQIFHIVHWESPSKNGLRVRLPNSAGTTDGIGRLTGSVLTRLVTSLTRWLIPFKWPTMWLAWAAHDKVDDLENGQRFGEAWTAGLAMSR
jgi:hypothetical protein